MSTWRVYFRSTFCPPVLHINGKVCEQLDIDGRLFLARGKSAPLPTERLRFGQRSAYCLRFPLKKSATSKGKKAPNNPAATTPSPHVVAPSKVKDVSDRVGIVSPQNQDHPATATQLHRQSPAPAIASAAIDAGEQDSTRKDSDDILIEASNTPEISPPGSPTPAITTAPVNPTPAQLWMTARSRNKRNRKVNTFTNLINRACPQPLNGLATSNYFDVL